MATEIIRRYGLRWTGKSDLQIELDMIARDGYWTVQGQKCGLGLFEHFMRARELVWPERYRHRWTDLIYQEIINNVVTILCGCASSGKTSTASEFVLLDYWAHPHDTDRPGIEHHARKARPRRMGRNYHAPQASKGSMAISERSPYVQPPRYQHGRFGRRRCA